MNPAGNRVILISENWLLTLYLADALRAASLEVVLIHKQGHYPKLASFYPIETLALETIDAVTLRDPLRRLCSDGRTRCIFPLSDELIRQCWRCDAELHPLIFPQLSEDLLELIGNKALMSRRAKDLGLAIPAFENQPSNEVALDFARQYGYPLVVKGATGVAGETVRIVADNHQLLSALDELADDQPVVQQFIDGPTVLGGGLFCNGQSLRLHLCEKTQIYPAGTGPSIKVRSLENNQLQQQVETLMSGLKWTGLASIDFIWNGAKFYFLEVNPRPWGAITAAQSANIALFAPLASLLLGVAIEPDLAFLANIEVCVFPGYLRYVADQRSILVLLKTLFSRSFWRGIPKTPWWLLKYFVLSKI